MKSCSTTGVEGFAFAVEVPMIEVVLFEVESSAFSPRLEDRVLRVESEEVGTEGEEVEVLEVVLFLDLPAP